MRTHMMLPNLKLKARKHKKPRTRNDPNAQQLSSETKESQDDNTINGSQLLDATIAAINVTKDLVPIDLAKVILGTVANILIIAQSVIKNQSDFQAVVGQCENIRQILESAAKDATSDDLQGYLGHALSQLDKTVNRIYSEVASKKEQGFLQRLLSVTSDRDRIVRWEKDLDRVIPLFNAQMLVGITIGMNMRTSGLEGNGNVQSYRPTEPPSRPSMFYGRDNLVAELTTLVVNADHIALIGPGGMGKSSLAKAVLHEPLIIKKFADRRFFVTYDGLDPSIITFETFMARFARALGIEIAGADPEHQISAFLRSASALIVLNNAETFEEASASSALEEIPLAIFRIAHIPGVILVLTSRSRRNAPNVQWVMKDIPPLELSSAQAAFFQIYDQAGPTTADEGINYILKALDFHPLSINLLANAAQQNGWSPPMLLKRWKDRHTKVLDHGKGKLQSLSDTMQLSLSSPSIQDLGEDGRRTLAVIAFLPQGLSGTLASELLPSLLQVDTICDVLRRHCLVYRQDSFVKMLAPIRHYVQDSLPAPDSTCLQEMRTFYYRTVQRCEEERDSYADIVISDHLNIEHLIAFDLARVPEETYRACWYFLLCLTWHLPRPTTLTSAIFNIVENSSTQTPKAHCLWYLGWLYITLSQLTAAMKALKAAEALYLIARDNENAAQCVMHRADLYRCQGRLIQSQQVLEDFQRSDSWKYVIETTKARVWYFLDRARMYTFATSVDELFVKSLEDHVWGLQSKIWHWRAKFNYGGDIVQANTHLEDLFLQCTSIRDLLACREALLGLAQIAFCEGRLSEAMDILQKIVEMFEGQHSDDVLWYTVLKAVVASRQGHHDLARELIHKSSGSFQFLALRNAHTFLHRSYSSACIELTAGEYDRAASHFTATIEGCNIQGNLDIKAHSIRGLGEVAFAHGNLTLAAGRFAETRALCTEMGVPARNLYSCFPFDALPDKFKGWALFLEGRSPFMNNM